MREVRAQKFPEILSCRNPNPGQRRRLRIALALLLAAPLAAEARAECDLNCIDPVVIELAEIGYFGDFPGIPLFETYVGGRPFVRYPGCDGPPVCTPPGLTSTGTPPQRIIFLPGEHQVICGYPLGGPSCSFTVTATLGDLGYAQLPDLAEPTAALGLLNLDGSLVTIGGERPNGATGAITVIIDENRQPANRSLNSLPFGRFNFGLGVCNDGAALIGGSGGGRDVVQLRSRELAGELVEHYWTQLLDQSTVNAAAVCVPGLGYVSMGGQAPDGTASDDVLLTVLLSGGEQKRLPDLIVPTQGNAAIWDGFPPILGDLSVSSQGDASLYEGRRSGSRILSFGGFNEQDGILATVQEYDLTTKQWRLLPDMPTRRFAPTATLGPDGRVYVTGGFGEAGFLATTDIATLTPDLSWSPGPSLRVPRSEAAAAASNDGLYVVGGFSDFRPTDAVEFLPIPGFACVNTAGALCVESREFEVAVTFRVPGGELQQAHAFALNGSSGYFTFFDETNIELVIKVLDASPVNGHIWVFGAGLTNLEVDIEVTHLPTGTTKRYFNPQGQPFGTITDTTAFLLGGGPGPPQQARVPAARDSEAHDFETLERVIAKGAALELRAGGPLFLAQERFRVDVTFQVPDGTLGVGEPTKLTSDSGYFTFFDPANVEIVAKVLDACTVNGKFWVFLAGLTDLGVTITVTDTTNGSVRTYENPPSNVFRSVLDIEAFPSC